MYFITTKRMLEVCFFQHTPTFIIEPKKIRTSQPRINAGFLEILIVDLRGIEPLSENQSPVLLLS